MNSTPFEAAPFAFLTLFPLFFFLLWLVVVIGGGIFAVVMALRFVKAHERIARSLERLADRPVPPPADSK